MELKIKKRNLCIGVYFVLFIPLIARFLTDNFGISYVFMPIFDVAVIFYMILITCFCNGTNVKGVRITWFFFWNLFIIAIISVLVNGGTLLSDFFYEIRPYLRMASMVVISAYILNIKNLEKIYTYIKYILYINILVMFVQYFILGLRQDIIGGTFGNSQGVNAIQNILCIFLFTVTIVKFLYKEIKIKELILNTITVLIITVLAEINFLLIEIGIIAIFAIFLISIYEKIKANFSARTIFLLISGGMAAIVGIFLFLKVNPDRAFLFSMDAILEYIGAKESTGVYRISRVGVFPQLGNMFFRDNIIGWLLGMGVGNCSIHTSFYNKYSSLQYNNFSSSFVFLQSGLIGVVGNLVIIVYIFIRSIKKRKKYKTVQQNAWNDVGVILMFISFLLFFYNSSLRDTYTAFWIGLFCSISFVVQKVGE